MLTFFNLLFLLHTALENRLKSLILYHYEWSELNVDIWIFTPKMKWELWNSKINENEIFWRFHTLWNSPIFFGIFVDEWFFPYYFPLVRRSIFSHVSIAKSIGQQLLLKSVPDFWWKGRWKKNAATRMMDLEMRKTTLEVNWIISHSS